jgi:hypothetical protein
LEELVVRQPLVTVRLPWNRGWRSDHHQGPVRPPGHISATTKTISPRRFAKDFQPIQIQRPLINLYRPRRGTVVLTQNSHKNKELE